MSAILNPIASPTPAISPSATSPAPISPGPTRPQIIILPKGNPDFRLQTIERTIHQLEPTSYERNMHKESRLPADPELKFSLSVQGQSWYLAVTKTELVLLNQISWMRYRIHSYTNPEPGLVYSRSTGECRICKDQATFQAVEQATTWLDTQF